MNCRERVPEAFRRVARSEAPEGLCGSLTAGHACTKESRSHRAVGRFPCKGRPRRWKVSPLGSQARAATVLAPRAPVPTDALGKFERGKANALGGGHPGACPPAVRGGCFRGPTGTLNALRRCLGAASQDPANDSYLVDSASSHMLVSKIKPCMSKYKQLYRETANGSLNQLSFI